MTNLSFNPSEPTILVGDDHGGATLLKLSPNLTRGGVVPKEHEEMSVNDYEKLKMENLINVAGKFQRDDV